MQNEAKLRISFLDDEENLVYGLRRFLRPMRQVWDMQFYCSAKDALAEIREFRPNLVVTDMRMPQMNGIEYLKEVRRICPDAIRFILSGFSDRDMIFNSVGLAHQFFTKPLDIEHLKDAIVYSNSIYRKIENPAIQEIVGGMDVLPTPTSTYDKINEELSKKESNLELVTKIVMEDATLSAKILQLVNSAFFGLPSNITDISQATMLLGVDVLKYLTLSLGCEDQSFPRLSSKFDIHGFLKHSIETARVCEQIAKDMGFSFKESKTAFAAGLMHDVGKLVMANYFQDRYLSSGKLIDVNFDSHNTLKLEESMFKTNHSLTGAALMAIWGLPPQIVKSIIYHHNPAEAEENEAGFSTIVHVANAISITQVSKTPILASELLDLDYINALGWGEKISVWSEKSNEIN